MVGAPSPVVKPSITPQANNAGQTTSSNGKSGNSGDTVANALTKLGRATLTGALNVVDSKGEIAAKGKQLLKTAFTVPGTNPTGTTSQVQTPTQQQPPASFGTPAGGVGTPSGGAQAGGAPKPQNSSGPGCGPNGSPPQNGNGEGSGGTTNPIQPGGGAVNNKGSGVYRTPTEINFTNDLKATKNTQENQQGNQQAIAQAEKEGVVIKNFTATWCGPCQQMSSTVSKLQSSTPIVKVDGDQNPEQVTKHGVTSYPAFIAGYKDPSSGKFVETGRVEGKATKEVIEKLYETAAKGQAAALKDKETAEAKAKETPKTQTKPEPKTESKISDEKKEIKSEKSTTTKEEPEAKEKPKAQIEPEAKEEPEVANKKSVEDDATIPSPFSIKPTEKLTDE